MLSVAVVLRVLVPVPPWQASHVQRNRVSAARPRLRRQVSAPIP